jgi:mRNA interferase RelE/StbE
MILEYERSFNKDLKKITDEKLKLDIAKLLIKLKKIPSISGIKNLKKMTGYQTYYRIRMGDYRIGLKIENQTTLKLIRFKHRKEIYKLFP